MEQRGLRVNRLVNANGQNPHEKSRQLGGDAATQISDSIGQPVELLMGKTLDDQFDPDEDEKNRDGKNNRIKVQIELLVYFVPTYARLKVKHMILKIIKAVWFLSLMAWLAQFLYVYASLPEEVLVRELENKVSLSREAVFYLFLAAIVLVNGLVFIVSRLFHGQEDFRSWFYGLVICFNFFFVIVLSFINLVNSGEKFNYDRIGYVIYGSVGLFVMWAIGWPVYSFFRKFLNKEVI